MITITGTRKKSESVHKTLSVLCGASLFIGMMILSKTIMDTDISNWFLILTGYIAGRSVLTIAFEAANKIYRLDSCDTESGFYYITKK